MPVPLSARRAAYEEKRRSRKREVRKMVLGFDRADKRRVSMAVLGLEGTEPRERRHLPMTRSECPDSGQPCPFVTCKYHLFLDVNSAKQSITLNFPDLEIDQLPHSCCLDIADQGGATLEQVGQIMNLTRERVRQIEESALRKLRRQKGLPR